MISLCSYKRFNVRMTLDKHVIQATEGQAVCVCVCVYVCVCVCVCVRVHVCVVLKLPQSAYKLLCWGAGV